MEEEKKSFDWQRLVITLSIVLLTAAVVGGGVWYFMNQNEVAQEKSYNDSIGALNKQVAALNNRYLKLQNENTAALSNSQASEEVAVKQVITNFENSYKDAYLGQSGANRESLLNTMFAYFTEPSTDSEKDLRSHLFYGRGTDGSLGGPTLFSTGSTNAYSVSFVIDSTTKTGDKYVVKVTEQKKKYYNGDNPPGYKTTSFSSIMDVVKVGNSWLIDKYYNSQYSDKYTAFSS